MRFVAPTRLLIVGVAAACASIVGFDSRADPVIAIERFDVMPSVVESPDEPLPNDGVAVAESGDDGGPSVVRGLIGAAVMIGVFVFGLTKIREQRRTGRTSKFPRIG